jgi:HD-GYP domain-containing protein (c-di-GMP phosphodiesterase class II)
VTEAGDDLRLADLLAGLSMVADLGFSLPPGTSVRSCLVAAALARRLDLPESDVRDCYYTALLLHAGCVGVAHESALAFGDDLALNRAAGRTNLADPADIERTLVPELTRDLRPDVAARSVAFAVEHGASWGRAADVGVCEVGRDTARQLGLPESTQQALYHVPEAWSGGYVPDGLRGDDIAVASRVARAAMDVALFSQLAGVDGARIALERRAGVTLDPGVVAAFAGDPSGLLAEVDHGDPVERLLEAEPGPVEIRRGPQLLEVGAAFGALADVKAPFLLGHAREVARLAAGGARRLGLPEPEVTRIELAGLLHDVGRVGISNGLWEKAGPLHRVEWELVRMHAYYSERILAASPSLAPLAPIVGMHHERLDGSGYHRSAAGSSIPVAPRLLAAADVFSALTSVRPYRPALTGEEAARHLVDDAQAKRLDHDAALAVLDEAGQAPGRTRPPRPAGLSEREVEVLALIAAGWSNAEVAERLFISRRTAEHHAQHIYAKIGVSTRAGAALFAVQHDLVSPR